MDPTRPNDPEGQPPPGDSPEPAGPSPSFEPDNGHQALEAAQEPGPEPEPQTWRPAQTPPPLPGVQPGAPPFQGGASVPYGRPSSPSFPAAPSVPPGPTIGIPRGPAAPPPPPAPPLMPAPGPMGAPPSWGYGQTPPAPPPGGPGYPPQWAPPGSPGRPAGWQAAPPAPPGRRPGLSGGRILLIVLSVLVLFVALIAVVTSSFSGGASALPTFGDKVGLLEVEGIIGDSIQYEANTRELIDTIHQWREDKSIRGIVVRINSPGGAVGATQELTAALSRYRKTGRPVVATMGDVAASGGYYTATACDEIIANPGTLTGSIGVILSIMNYQGLTEKIGLRFNPIKSGEFKDIGSGSRPMTEAERELLQAVVDDVQTQFVQAVADGRGEVMRERLAEQSGRERADVSDEEFDAYLKTLTDGRIFSGQQAFEAGLVDELGSMRTAVERVKALAGIAGEPRLVTSKRPKSLMDVLGGETRSMLRQLGPGQVLLEYRLSFP